MSKTKIQTDPSAIARVEQMDYSLLEAEKIARQAKRGNKSLKGNNSYAEKFYELRTNITRLFREMQSMAMPTANAGLERTIADIEKELGYFFDPKTSEYDRRDLRRHISMLVRTEVDPALKNSQQQKADFIPLEIVDKSRGYVVNVARQVNQCFQNDCFDACGVMTRRLLETLIIEVFEKKGLANNIKDGGGNYLMFSELVGRLINTPETPVGRTTKKELPTIATVLNNCAHSRTFNISKAQLVQYQAFIIISVQELMSLWDIRRP